MKTKIIHSKKVAEELIKRNNNLLTIEKHNKNKKYSVFRFKETDKLLKDLTEITNKNN